jgi:hypothetical protein
MRSSFYLFGFVVALALPLASCSEKGSTSGSTAASFQPETFINMKTAQELRLRTATECDVHSRKRTTKRESNRNARTANTITGTWSEADGAVRVKIAVLGSDKILAFTRQADRLVGENSDVWFSMAAAEGLLKAESERLSEVAHAFCQLALDHDGRLDEDQDGTLTGEQVRKVVLPKKLLPTAEGKGDPTRDIWGSQLVVVFDNDDDGRVPIPHLPPDGYEADEFVQCQCLVVSAGPDGKYETIDDYVMGKWPVK